MNDEVKNKIHAVVVLKPAEAKQLIAKAVAQLPEVAYARQHGKIVIALGTTNAFVAEEILQQPLAKKDNYVGGMITGSKLAVLPASQMAQPVVLVKGQRSELSIPEVIAQFGSDDVYIKGANAVDPEGNVGILLASETGGTTVGKALPIIFSRGSKLIVPVGLEKLVPSVREAASKCGTRVFKYADGMKVGYMAIVSAKVITEVQAFQVLANVLATPIASGGIWGSEGSMTLSLEGDEESITQAWELVRTIKGA